MKLEDHAKNGDRFFESSDNARARCGRRTGAHARLSPSCFPDYHKPGDEWQKIDYDNMAKITRAVTAGVLAIANRAEPAAMADQKSEGGAVREKGYSPLKTSRGFCPRIRKLASHPEAAAIKAVATMLERFGNRSTRS